MSAAQFEHFLVRQLTEWLENRVNAGSRYQFQSPDSDNTHRLFMALKDLATGIINFKDVELPYVTINGVKLVCVAHAESREQLPEGFNENYISMLRDEIAGRTGPLEGCALLIIHNSLLDTLINSADNLATPGAIWATETVQQRIDDLINSQPKQNRVLACLLQWQAEQLSEEGGSMFGFRKLFQSITAGDEPDLTELGLLPDHSIAEMTSDAQINRRLKENRKLFNEIDTVVHHFPEELTERLPDLGEKFIKEHFQKAETGHWQSVDFTDYSDEINKQRNQQLEYSNTESESCALIGPRNKKETGAGPRDKHLIIVVPEAQDWFDLKLTFLGSSLDKDQITLQHNKTLTGQQTSLIKVAGSKNRNVSLRAPFTGEPVYFTLKTNRPITKECYAFSVLVLREDDFHLADIENKFLVNARQQCLTLQTEDHELLINPTCSDTCHLKENDKAINAFEYGVINYQTLYEESDIVTFSVTSGDNQLVFNIEGEASQETLSLPLLMNADRFNLLFNDNYNGQLLSNKGKVVLDNRENKVVGRRLSLLQREEAFIEKNLITQGSHAANTDQLEVDAPEIYRAWRELVTYLQRKKTLLSLASWGPELTALVRQYVSACLNDLNAIPLNHSLSDANRRIIRLGQAEFEGKQWFSPFHPLVLAYYLKLVDAIKADSANRSFKDLPPVTRKRLNPKGLLPYIFDTEHDFSYVQTVEDNPFWLEIVPQEKTSYSFVSKLVRGKVEEFVKTFRELFRQVDDAPLIINSVNNSDNHEIFTGLLEYYKTHLTESHHIHVNLYDDALCETEFDRFAEMGAYDQIKLAYNLDKGTKNRENADTVIDLLRTRLSFSKFRHEDVDSQAYAHLSFFKNNQKIQRVSSDIDEHISGVACDGLLNGEASSSENASYLTAFGLRHIETTDEPHLALARLYGRLMQPCQVVNEQYHKRSSIGLAVSDQFRALLERSYASSLWTTIIDPKVTLDFFRQEQNLILIHYSDQYTNSAGYDAITVTRQTDLYRKMLSQTGDDLISEFNAFNGEWLLKMVTERETERKGKQGIIGAWKLVSCLLAGSDITWVPLSVGEMVRVAGNIGLNMKDSDFARYHKNPNNRGKMSDDILFVGFQENHLYLLPVEVKTGQHGSSSLENAREQARALGEYLTVGLFGPETLAGRLYRSLLMRQVLLQIEKYQLYNVFDADYFHPILDHREHWLSGDYKLGSLNDYPTGLVVAHLDGEGVYQTQTEQFDDILQLEIPISYLEMLVNQPLKTLKPKLIDENKLHIDKRWFMGEALASSTYQPPVEAADEETPESADETSADAVTPELPSETDNTPAQTTVETDSSNKAAMKLQFGTEVMSGQPAFWEVTNTEKILNPNTAIIGTMGTGKTQFTKSLITQLVREQDKNVDGLPLGILILDYKADYIKDDFVKATNAKVFDLYNLPFNPLALFGNKPMLPVHTANLFRSTLCTAFNLGPKQQNKVRNLVMDAYDKAGIKPQDLTTWSRPAPTIQQVWDIFEAEEKVERDTLYAALDDLISFQIFESQPENTQSLYDMVNGVTVINLSGYDPKIQNLVVAITLDIFYNQMHQQGSSKIDGKYRQLTKFVLVDEADNFMRQDFTSLRMLLKEGREFGVGTILSTQELDHFRTDDNDFSSYINTWVIHKVSKLKRQDIQAIFNTSGKSEEERIMGQILELEKHRSIYVGGKDKPKKIQDLAFWELIKK